VNRRTGLVSADPAQWVAASFPNRHEPLKPGARMVDNTRQEPTDAW
jgi:hypothetical protein